MQDAASSGGPSGETVLLHVFPSFSFGGQQARLAALARGLGTGYRHVIVALDGDHAARALFDESVKAKFRTLILKKSSGLSLSNIWRLRGLLREEDPDILCTYNWGSMETVVANKLGPRVPHVHFEDGFGPDETIDRQRPRRVRARRRLLKKTPVVVPSRALEKTAAEQWGLKSVRRIGNGVDFDRLQGGKRGHNDALVVGSLAALRPEKNYRRLIAVFRAADYEGRARLEIFGAGPELDALRQAAKDDPRISLPGPTADAADAYARFDVFALSSDTEQAPLSLMEAMAAGLPVVATGVGDIAEMVAEENLPYITPVGDDEAYAHALAQMLQNPSARAAIGAANKRKAREAFSQDRMIAACRALFEDVQGRHG
ncbi:glycosyltransferase family 4 protein [Hyphococcus luteus]|uniref:Glycosyltransferase family 1 protein n=1 Tax=Hyphococcus luteus TaxID=2058213 RepID=A0A2S7JZT0_9PROT|nr:glycosyltransferase family 4 protein [Marinicaulis flavus]PQA85708.1 glycosyltransferase family 1 protein [Marinicaulis flavus]